MKNQPCCCGSHKPFKACCGPFLSGELKPELPEQLMRSRFSAFCTKNVEYLLNSHHPQSQGQHDRQALKNTVQNTEWVALKIIKADNSQLDNGIGYVEFAAFYNSNGPGQLHENSRFIKEDGEWYYAEGILLEPLKFTRNEPCWCGSNKKYKKCHGRSS